MWNRQGMGMNPGMGHMPSHPGSGYQNQMQSFFSQNQTPPSVVNQQRMSMPPPQMPVATNFTPVQDTISSADMDIEDEDGDNVSQLFSQSHWHSFDLFCFSNVGSRPVLCSK